MQTNVRKRAGTLIGCVALIATLLWAYSGRSTPPGLTAALSTNNTLQITITNGVAGEVYVIEYSVTLETADDWQVYSIGQTNQTNFTVGMSFPQSFYRAFSGTDWDSDGIPNWADSDPNNASLGALTVIIESPLNGSTIY